MTAAVSELPVRDRTAKQADPKDVVAVILADGSVRELRGPHGRAADGRRHAAGSLSGSDWILWWERRAFR